jgi:hypothetical protein
MGTVVGGVFLVADMVRKRIEGGGNMGEPAEAPEQNSSSSPDAT